VFLVYYYHSRENRKTNKEIDAFNHEDRRGGGFKKKLTKADTITYLGKLSKEAQKYNMATGLKNAEELLPQVQGMVQFAVNEECASMSNSDGCDPYLPFLDAGKPVFHIEYAKYKVNNQTGKVTLTSDKSGLRTMASDKLEQLYCLETGLPRSRRKALGKVQGARFSTVTKVLGLNGWVLYCDGTQATTETVKAPGTPADRPARGGRRGATPKGDGAAPAANSVAGAPASSVIFTTDLEID
jgi:hypothetical protein